MATEFRKTGISVVGDMPWGTHFCSFYEPTIKDNGRGISDDEKSRPEALGLLGMRERVSLIGGQIDIMGVEGDGTVVTVRVPLFG